MCTNRPDFGDVTLEWDDEREPGRVSDEATLACPEKHRSNTTLTSHITTIICTPDGWVDVDPCVKGEQQDGCELLIFKEVMNEQGYELN